MRTLDSWKREEARLRARHTQQTSDEKWREADTTRRKLIMVLDKINELEKAASALLPKPPTPNA